MDFITPNRFDLMAKYLYVKYKHLDLLFYKELYLKHIEVFNKCWEHPGTKVNVDDFIKSFDNLIESIKNNGYNSNYPIEIGNNNVIINGSHRLMISYFYNIKPILKFEHKKGCEYNYDFFVNRNNYWRRDNEKYINLEHVYADTMALEYVKIKNNIRSIVFYPIVYQLLQDNFEQIYKIIQEYGYLYYQKQIKLTEQGVRNLIKEMYRGESWIGGMFPNDSCGGKFECCYEDNPVFLYLVEFNDVSKIVEFKDKIRKIFKKDKHSLHIPDDQDDTFRISSSLLNKNSIYFLNTAKTNNYKKSVRMNKLLYIFEKLNDKENIIFTSSLILEMYGIRDAKDIDYIHIGDKIYNLPFLGCHIGKWLKFYPVSKKDILYDPNHFFYFNSYKFATLKLIKKMKQIRNEDKDKKDNILINRFMI